MKVFISQPMQGRRDADIIDERESVAKKLVGKYGNELRVINSFIKDLPPESGNAPLWCLGRSIQMMSEADLVYFCKGWMEARGCKLEHECAVAYGMQVVEESEE